MNPTLGSISIVIIVIIIFVFVKKVNSKKSKKSAKIPDKIKIIEPANKQREKEGVFNSTHNDLFKKEETTQESEKDSFSSQDNQQGLKDPEEEFCEIMRNSIEKRIPFQETFSEALQKSGFDFEDAIREADNNNWCKDIDIVSMLAKRNYSLQEIAQFFENYINFKVGDLTELLMPYATGDTPKEKAKEVYDVVWENTSANDDDRNDALQCFKKIGCTDEDLIFLLYDSSSMYFGELIKILHIENNPEKIIELSKEMDIDLADDDEYDSLRKNDVSFETVIKILKKIGMSVTEILDNEDNSQGVGEDDFENLLKSFIDADFTLNDFMYGAWNSNLGCFNERSDCIYAFYNAKIPLEKIVEFAIEQQIDPDELNDELKDDGVDFTTRVKILNGFVDKEN